MHSDPTTATQRSGPVRRLLPWALLVLSLVLIAASVVLLVERYRTRAEPPGAGARPPEHEMSGDEAGPSPDDCRTPATDALGLGLTRFGSESEMVEALGEELLLPNPSTLPTGTAFADGYYNAGMQGDYRQSTIGLRYKATEATVEIALFNIRQYAGPVEEHTPVVLRGKDGYLFAPPFQEGLHSVMWREGCRWVTVLADLPAEAVLAIAEGLRAPPVG